MTDLKSALVDVRRAYRLLWSYQRRMIDLVQLIGDGFDTHKFYAWASPSFDRQTNLTSTPLKKWAWDGLPFYKVCFLFMPTEASPHNPKAGDWLLEVFLDTDNVDVQQMRGEPDASKFPDATTTASMLKLVAWKCTKDVSANWFRDIWRSSDWPPVDGVPFQVPGKPVVSMSLSVPLEELSNRQSVMNLISTFRAKVQTQLGIVLP